MIHWTRLFEQLESEGLKPVFPPRGLLVGTAMRAARKEANPGLAFVVPARTKRRWWRQNCAHGEVRLLTDPVSLPSRGKPSGAAPVAAAVVVFGRPASMSRWDFPGSSGTNAEPDMPGSP